MGMLDNMFAGSNGIVHTLHELFGSTAIIRRIDNRTYHELHDLTVTNGSEEIVPFIPEKLECQSKPGENGSLWHDAELVGTIPSTALTRLPRANLDQIVFEQIVYDIVLVVELYTGSTRTTVRIGGKRS